MIRALDQWLWFVDETKKRFPISQRDNKRALVDYQVGRSCTKSGFLERISHIIHRMCVYACAHVCVSRVESNFPKPSQVDNVQLVKFKARETNYLIGFNGCVKGRNEENMKCMHTHLRARTRKPFSASIRDKLGEYRKKTSPKEKAYIAKKSCPTDVTATIKCWARAIVISSIVRKMPSCRCILATVTLYDVRTDP